MAFTVQGKLEKMKFKFFTDSEFQKPAEMKEFEVMYNPSSFQMTYANQNDRGKKKGSGTIGQKYTARTPRELSIDLIFDGTFASPTNTAIGSLKSNFESFTGVKAHDVSKQIKKFLNGAYVIDGETHRPTYVQVIWGSVSFDAVFISATATYKLFAPNGTPLRASLAVKLKEHLNEKKFKQEISLKSPDLTRVHRIAEGDRIDALCEKYYGDASLYHEIARVNNLTNKRKLTPGNTLIFPPIDKRN